MVEGEMSGVNTLLPWGCCLVLSIVAGIGWSRAFEYKIQTNSVEQNIEVSKQKSKRKLVENNETAFSPDDFTQHPTKGVVIQPHTTMEEGQKNLSSQQIQACLQSVAVRDAIADQAESISEELAVVKVKEEMDKKREKEIEGVYEYLDKSEEFVLNGTNAYIEQFDLAPDVAGKLHQIITDGYNTQRDILVRLQDGDITDEEAKTLGKESHEADKKEIVELLGEDGAADLRDVIIEDAQSSKDE